MNYRIGRKRMSTVVMMIRNVSYNAWRLALDQHSWN